MYIVIDDLFSDDIRNRILEFSKTELGVGWAHNGDFPECDKILDIVGKYFDLEDMVGYEIWRNEGEDTPGKHVDMDERMFHQKGILNYPLCSIVYYAFVDSNLIGGEFVTKDFQVKPIQNRLICFSPGIEHDVNKFQGNRVSVAINPFPYEIDPPRYLNSIQYVE